MGSITSGAAVCSEKQCREGGRRGEGGGRSGLGGELVSEGDPISVITSSTMTTCFLHKTGAHRMSEVRGNVTGRWAALRDVAVRKGVPALRDMGARAEELVRQLEPHSYRLGPGKECPRTQVRSRRPVWVVGRARAISLLAA